MLRRSATIAVLAGVLALPAGAHADAYDDVLADFKADERITACDHQGPDLLMAKVLAPSKTGVPEGFVPAVDKAIATVSEGCEKGEAGAQLDAAAASTTATTATTATTPPVTTPPVETTPVETTPVETTPVDPAAAAATPPTTTTPPPAQTATTAATTTAADDDGLAPGAVAGIAAGVLVLLLLLVWALARFFAWDPVWLARTRHAIAEAGWRTSGVWEDFADWLRGGRPRRS